MTKLVEISPTIDAGHILQALILIGGIVYGYSQLRANQDAAEKARLEEKQNEEVYRVAMANQRDKDQEEVTSEIRAVDKKIDAFHDTILAKMEVLPDQRAALTELDRRATADHTELDKLRDEFDLLDKQVAGTKLDIQHIYENGERMRTR